MKSRLALSARSRQFTYWLVLLILAISSSGCEFQQNPNPPSAENPAIQDLALVTPDDNIVLQDIDFIDANPVGMSAPPGMMPTTATPRRKPAAISRPPSTAQWMTIPFILLMAVIMNSFSLPNR